MLSSRITQNKMQLAAVNTHLLESPSSLLSLPLPLLSSPISGRKEQREILLKIKQDGIAQVLSVQGSSQQQHIMVTLSTLEYTVNRTATVVSTVQEYAVEEEPFARASLPKFSIQVGIHLHHSSGEYITGIYSLISLTWPLYLPRLNVTYPTVIP